MSSFSLNILRICLPIHLLPHSEYQDPKQYPGSQLLNVSGESLKLPKAELIESLHEELVTLTRKVFNKLKNSKGRTPNLCLVEGPERAYYFKDDGIEYSTEIPSGGNLVTQSNELIGMNQLHYKK